MLPRAPRLAPLAAVLALAAMVPAQNDECTGAMPLNLGLTSGLSNNGATLSAGVPGACAAIGADVWFSYTATCTGQFSAATCSGTSFDTVLQVLSGTCAALTSLGCNDDACNLQSLVTVSATVGTTYFIRVGGYQGATGTFGLVLSCVPGTGSGDDNCAGATALSLGVNGPFSNVGYSTSPPSWPCGNGRNDRWFSYAATFTGPHTIQTCTPNLGLDSTLEVFSGTCAGLTSLGCNDDSCSLGSALQVNLTANNTYYVRVGGYSGSVGTFDVEVSLGNGTGTIRLAAQSGCGSATLTFSGAPTLGSSFTANLGGITGTPLMGLGFANPDQLFCGCTFGTDWTWVQFGSSLNFAVPANPSYLNVSFFAQGADFGATGGCGWVPYTLTDSFEITIG